MPAQVTAKRLYVVGSLALVLSVFALFTSLSGCGGPLAFAASGSCPVGNLETFASGIVINDDSNNSAGNGDLRVESDTDANALTLDSDTGRVYIGSNAQTNSVAGATISQGATIGEALAVKSTDIAHGITGITETDTYGYWTRYAPLTGGLFAVGLGEANIGQWQSGMVTTEVTTKTSASEAAIILDGRLRTGTTVTTMGANANILAVGTNGSQRFIVDSDGDTFQLGATGFLQSGDPTGITDTAHVYAKDNAGTAEVFVRDEAGNVTQISPHDPTTNHLVVSSCNLFTGVCKTIDIEAALQMLGLLAGKNLIEETPLPPAQVLNWDAEQTRLAAGRAAEIAAWDAAPVKPGPRPLPYLPEPKPAWLVAAGK